MSALKARKSHKDVPRYKTVSGYERSFKTAYAKMLGEALAEAVMKMKMLVKSK